MVSVVAGVSAGAVLVERFDMSGYWQCSWPWGATTETPQLFMITSSKGLTWTPLL